MRVNEYRVEISNKNLLYIDIRYINHKIKCGYRQLTISICFSRKVKNILYSIHLLLIIFTFSIILDLLSVILCCKM